MIDATTIERLTPYIPRDIDLVGTGSSEDLIKSYAARRGVPIEIAFAKTYPISSMALLHFPEKGDALALARPDHPYLNDLQGLHALAHLLMGDQVHDDLEYPPTHLLLADPHERDVATLAIMVLIAWESAPPPAHHHPPIRLFNFRRRAPALPAPTLPTFDPIHLMALLDFFAARLAYSLAHSPGGVTMMMGCSRGSWPHLSTMSVAAVRQMTDDLLAGRGDEWDDMVRIAASFDASAAIAALKLQVDAHP